MEARQKKIIVPLDFKKCSLAALNVGVRMAQIHDSEVVLLYVVESYSQILEFLKDDDLNEKTRLKASKQMDLLIEKYQNHEVRISKMFEKGKPYKGILRASNDLLSELIVMGVHGEEELEPGFLGSNVAKVIRGAHCPVLTVNEEMKNVRFDRILVPVDPKVGIRELRAYLHLYAENFKPYINLVTVVSPGQKTDLEDHLEKQKAALAHQGIADVEWHILEGGLISETILEHANKNNIDMIWMETQGRKGLVGLLLGSVTEEVLASSKVPVLSLYPERSTTGGYYYHSNLPI